MRAVEAEIKKKAPGRNRRPSNHLERKTGVRDSLSTDRIRITPPPVVERLHRVHHLGGSFRDALARSHLVAVALHYSTAKCVRGNLF